MISKALEHVIHGIAFVGDVRISGVEHALEYVEVLVDVVIDLLPEWYLLDLGSASRTSWFELSWMWDFDDCAGRM